MPHLALDRYASVSKSCQSILLLGREVVPRDCLIHVGAGNATANRLTVPCRLAHYMSMVASLAHCIDAGDEKDSEAALGQVALHMMRSSSITATTWLPARLC